MKNKILVKTEFMKFFLVKIIVAKMFTTNVGTKHKWNRVKQRFTVLYTVLFPTRAIFFLLGLFRHHGDNVCTTHHNHTVFRLANLTSISRAYTKLLTNDVDLDVSVNLKDLIWCLH